MSSSVVLGSRAEAACRLLNQTLGRHRTQGPSNQDTKVPARLTSPAFDGLQGERQATFLRMISITEAFCVDRLLDLAEEEVSPTGNRIRNQIWERASSSAVSTWSSIQESYKNWYGVRPSWTTMDQLVEVRNAIAHGLGQLTRIQRAKRRSTVARIVQTGIRLNGDWIVLEEEDLETAKNACIGLISELDVLVQAETLNVD